MHDPMTVAHEIGFTWGKNKLGYKRRFHLVTIWHVDPEINVLGCRDDDSCGWFSPGYTKEELEQVKKLAKSQYDQLFARQVAYANNKSYFDICYDQTIHGAIYWSWRALKAQGKAGWQYGKDLSHKETEYIFKLSYDPADNFQSRSIKRYQDFEDFFIQVWRCLRRFYRPWYKHPRWHIHHWKIQIHPIQRFKRRFLDKCSVCGKRGFKTSPFSDWSGKKIWCSDCNKSTLKAPPVDGNLRDTI